MPARKLSFLLLLLFSLDTQSQQIENSSFDSVYIGGIDRVHSWITSDAWSFFNDTVQPLASSTYFPALGLMYHELLYSVQLDYTSAFHGPFAIQLFSDSNRYDIHGNLSPGFIVNGNAFYTDGSGYIDLIKCGAPFPFRPVKLHGRYKFSEESASGVFPEARLLLKKYNSTLQESDTIGFGYLSTEFLADTNWTSFEMPITYLNADIPDSLVLAFYAPESGLPATFQVDSLWMEYATTSIYEAFQAETFYSNDKIYLSNPTKIKSISVTDVPGRTYMNLAPEKIIDVSDWSPGIFILILEDINGNRSLRKFVR